MSDVALRQSGLDVIMGGGAENFNGTGALRGQNYYNIAASRGYSVIYNNSALTNASNSQPLLGVFCQSNMDKWYDRNVNLQGRARNNSPTFDGTNAYDQPGLKQMTLKVSLPSIVHSLLTVLKLRLLTS